MKITDYIKSFFGSKNHILRVTPRGYMPDWGISTHKFGETIYLNAVELVTDIFASVTWTCPVETPMFKAWRDWVYRNGQRILVQMLRGDGFAVIGYESYVSATGDVQYSFYELGSNKWHIIRKGDVDIVECYDEQQRFYVLREPTYEATGQSSHKWCEPYIKLLDAVLNGATTTSERLGAFVIMSPQSDNFGGVLTEQDAKEVEAQLETEYGMLSRQKQVMLLQRPMSSQVVSLAGLDIKMWDKAKIAILAIADRLKVPANQIAIIDGGQAKAFANGTEYREGDVAKYKTARRLFNVTFYDMGHELGMNVDYKIEDEPKTVQNQTIEQ